MTLKWFLELLCLINESLDFNRDLIKHPEATFYGRVQGDSMEGRRRVRG
jgi:SOS-response transcriptional repressor LexA